MYDYAVQASELKERAIGNYDIYTGTYYDGYFYGYNVNLQFIRVDAAQRLDYAILNEGVAEGLAVDDSGYATEQVTAMAYDYTTATMYSLVLPVGSEMGYLASIDLDTGAGDQAPPAGSEGLCSGHRMIREPCTQQAATPM